jgi:hypothetical protein
LSDQINGDESLHLDIRKRVCEYMLRNRDQFEPFVAALIDESDDETNNKHHSKSKKNQASKNNTANMDAYELYIKNLEKPGTYADNGVLVAFSRLYNLDINIHQLDQPIWTINGAIINSKKNNQPIRQLHLSYHNGEHYSSIRPKGDRTSNPTNIIVNNNNCSSSSATASFSSNSSSSNNNNNNYHLKNNSDSNFFDTNNLDDFENDDYFNKDFNQTFNETTEIYNNISVDAIIDSTGCSDVNLILKILDQNNGDLEMTIDSLMSKMQLNSNNDEQVDSNNDDDDDKDSNTKNKSKSSSSKQIKIDKKKEKKSRQMERQRNKILEQREQDAHSQSASANRKEIKPSQIIDLESNSTDYNILLNNIEKKSI